MDRRFSIFLPLAISLVSFLILLGGNTSADGGFRENSKAPDFSLYDSGGKKINLSDFTGKVVLVNFWASWCPPCRAEMPGFQKVYVRYREKGFAIVGVSVDEFKPSLLNSMGITYPVVRSNAKIQRDYGVSFGIPISFLVGKDGRIIKKVSGVYEEADLKADVESALNRQGG